MDRNIWRELRPSPLELLIYAILSSFVLAGINIAFIIDRLTGQMLVGQFSSEDYLGILSGASKIPLVNTAVIVVFWSGVGLIAYTVVWAGINVAIEARNEIVVESEYINKGSAWNRLQAPLLKGALLSLLLGWVVLNRWRLLPWLLTNFNQTIVHGHGTQLVSLLLPMILGVADLSVVVMLFKAAFHSGEIVSSLHPRAETL